MGLLRHAVALLVGVVVALAAVAVHRTAFPLGLLLALGTTYAVPYWLLHTRHPRTAFTFAAGWLAMFAAVVFGRPEGDYAIAQDLQGYALMLTGLGLVVVGLVGLTRENRSSP